MGNNRWVTDSFTSVQRTEAQFHDSWAECIQIDDLLVNETFHAVTAVENRYILSLLGNLENKRILDLGCGAGESAVYFALQKAQVTAVDVSAGMLNVTERLADKFNISVQTKQAVAENTELPTGFFDFVYGYGVLHHVNLDLTLGEVERLLNRHGIAVFIEPLVYNPVIEIYRHLAKTVRTKDEKPFRFNKLLIARKYFPYVEHREFWFLTLFLFIYFFIFERVHPSKVRFWKKIVKDSEKYRVMFTVLKKMDDVLLTLIPPLRIFCWNTVLILKKSK